MSEQERRGEKAKQVWALIHHDAVVFWSLRRARDRPKVRRAGRKLHSCAHRERLKQMTDQLRRETLAYRAGLEAWWAHQAAFGEPLYRGRGLLVSAGHSAVV